MIVLFKTVESFPKLTHMRGASLIGEIKGLGHIYLIWKMLMKKGIVGV